MTAIHRSAAQGFSAKASQYAAGRPDYPPELSGWLTGTLGLGAGRQVLDLGSGTGKFLPRLLDTGAEVTAVEPVAEMRAQLSARFPGVTALQGTAETIPLGDGTMDAVVCAQAFHWFANADALAEIRRVLRPGGRLGLIWNVRDESVGWVASLTRLMTPYEGDSPRFYSGRWREQFPAEGFGPLVESRFSNDQTGPAERVIVDRVLSVSFIGSLPADEQERFAAQVRGLIDDTPELAGKDEVTFPYSTSAYCCEKLT